MRRKTILTGAVAMILAMSVFTACGNAEETDEKSDSTTVESHEGGEEGKCGEGKCGDEKCGSNENSDSKCGEGKCGG